MKIFGIIFVIAGFTLRYWLGKRAFNRRAITGLEGFKSYENMQLTKLLEGIIRLSSVVLILGGIILFLLSLISLYSVHHQIQHK